MDGYSLRNGLETKAWAVTLLRQTLACDMHKWTWPGVILTLPLRASSPFHLYIPRRRVRMGKIQRALVVSCFLSTVTVFTSIVIVCERCQEKRDRRSGVVVFWAF